MFVFFFFILSINSHYFQQNPWAHLMLSKRIDAAIDEVDSFVFDSFLFVYLSFFFFHLVLLFMS